MKRKTFQIFSIYLFFSLFSIYTFAQTSISEGSVSGLWTSNESPYIVSGDIEIPYDSTLSIEPGVIVEFQGYYELNVKGALSAIGSKTDSIVFTINDTTGFNNPDSINGGWKGIRIVDPDTTSDSTKIIFCKIEYAKAVGPVWHLNAGGAITVINFDKVRVSNSLFCNNSAGGDSTEVPSGGAIHLAWSDIQIIENTFLHNRAVTGGAVQIHESSPYFKNNIFIRNYAREGGAITCSGFSNLFFDGDNFNSNKALSHGGGVMCYDSAATFKNVSFTNNSAYWGGGIGAVNSNILISGCKIISNKAVWLGGGIASDFTSLIIENSIIDSNSSDDASGGIHSYYSTVNSNSSDFKFNNANFGGAIHSDFSKLEFNKCVFDNNAALNGGAVHSWMCDLIIDDCLFLQNSAVSEGGAIEFNIDTSKHSNMYLLNLTNTKFIQNTAEFRSGAIRIEQYNSESSMINMLIDNCEFLENHAERNGAIRISVNICGFVISNSIFNKNYVDMFSGAISAGGNLTGSVYNCLFTENSSVGNPAAFGITNGANIDFINCTFANNHGNQGAVFSLRRGGDATVTNCILWGNTRNAILMTSVTDSTPCRININYSDIQNGIDSIHYNDSISTIIWGDGNISADPFFVDTLKNNFSLHDNSPCIGSGFKSIEINDKIISSPDTDILGNQRPSPDGSNPDMGAYENILGIPTTVAINNNNIPKIIHLEQNYPNPLNPVTRIKYSIPVGVKSEKAKVKSVTLKIFDLLGREVETLVNENQKPGNYEVIWDGSIRPSGVYFYKIKVNEFSQVKKMMLLK
jgi:hypothetical protein